MALHSRTRRVSNPTPALSALTGAFLTGAGIMALVAYGWPDLVAMVMQ